MASSDVKQRFQLCLEQLTSADSKQGVSADWDQLLQEQMTSVQEVFSLLSVKEIRRIKEKSPENLSKLCIKVQRTLYRSSSKKLILVGWQAEWGSGEQLQEFIRPALSHQQRQTPHQDHPSRVRGSRLDQHVLEQPSAWEAAVSCSESPALSIWSPLLSR